MRANKSHKPDRPGAEEYRRRRGGAEASESFIVPTTTGNPIPGGPGRGKGGPLKQNRGRER